MPRRSLASSWLPCQPEGETESRREGKKKFNFAKLPKQAEAAKVASEILIFNEAVGGRQADCSSQNGAVETGARPLTDGCCCENLYEPLSKSA